MDAELRLLLNELQHLLTLNGLKGKQHVLYIAEELGAKAESRDQQDHGRFDQHTRSCKRATELLLKHEAYEMCFDAFFQSCSMHEPSYQSTFQQKLWRHAMLLVEDWQVLHEQQQLQLNSLALDHVHLQQEHKALKANLKTLKVTVQNMLADVSALLQHTARHKEPEQVAAVATSCSPSPPCSSNDRPGSAGSCQPGADPSSSHAPTAPVRRSTDIVHSLIQSIERMTKQFADCQIGRLSASAASDTSGRATPDQDQQLKSLDERRLAFSSNEQQGAAAASTASLQSSNAHSHAGECSTVAAAATASCSQASHASTAASSRSSGSASRCSSSRCSSASGDMPHKSALKRSSSSAQQPREAGATGNAPSGPEPKGGLPPSAAPASVKSKHISWRLHNNKSPGQQQGSERRNMSIARSAAGPQVKRDSSMALAGASPHRSHPPSAFDSSLAWFVQNAQCEDSSGICSGRKGEGVQSTGPHHAGSGKEQPAAAADETAEAAVTSPSGVPTRGQDLSVCKSATDSSSSPQAGTADGSSTGMATPQSNLQQHSDNEAQQRAPVAQCGTMDRSEAAALDGAITSTTGQTAAGGNTAEAAVSTTTTSLQEPGWVCSSVDAPAAAGSAKRSPQPGWVMKLMQRPEALQAVRAAMQYARSPGELLPDEPSMSDWACAPTGCDVAAAAAAAAAAGAAADPLGEVAESSAGSSTTSSGAAIQRIRGGSSNTSTKTAGVGDRPQCSQHPPAQAWLKGAAEQGQVLSTVAPWRSQSGYALAAAHQHQEQRQSQLRTVAKIHEQQQLHRDCIDSAARPELLQQQNVYPGSGCMVHAAGSTLGCKRPASSQEAKTTIYGGSSLAAAVPGRSRSAGADFASMNPAGAAMSAAAAGSRGTQWAPAVTAGPLTSALHKHSQVRQPAGPIVPAAESLAAAGAANAGQPALSSAAHRTSGAVSSGRGAGAGAGDWGTRAAEMADRAEAPAAAGAYSEPGNAAGAAPGPSSNRGSSLRAAWERQHSNSQRLIPRREQQQQQYMAAVPEGVLMAGELCDAAAVAVPAGNAYSTASSSIGSDMVRLGSCNAGFWLGTAVNSSPPDKSTASQANSPLAEAAGDGPTVPTETSVVQIGVAALLGVAAKPAVEDHSLLAASAALSAAAGEVADAAAAADNAAAGVGHHCAATGSSTSSAEQTAGAVVTNASGSNSAETADDAAVAAVVSAEHSSIDAQPAAYERLLGAAAVAAGFGVIDTARDLPVVLAVKAKAAAVCGAAITNDLPDAINSADRADSPHKQSRKAAAAAAAARSARAAAPTSTLEAAAALVAVPSGMRASGDKRALQASRTSFGNSNSGQHKTHLRGRQAAGVKGTNGSAACAAAADDGPASPLSPLSKKLRSSLVLVQNVLYDDQQDLSPTAGVTATTAAAVAGGGGNEAPPPQSNKACEVSSTAAAIAFGANCSAEQPLSNHHEEEAGADRTTSSSGQQPGNLHEAAPPVARVGEDGGRDVGPDRDRDTVGSKQCCSTVAASGGEVAPPGGAPAGDTRSVFTACDKLEAHMGGSSTGRSSCHRAAVPVAAGGIEGDIDGTEAGRLDNLIVVTTASLGVAEAVLSADSAGTAPPPNVEAVCAVLGLVSSSNSSAVADLPAAADRLGVDSRKSLATVTSQHAAEESEEGEQEVPQRQELPPPPKQQQQQDGDDTESSQKRQQQVDASAGAGDLSFSLDELVAILVDVMNSKHEQDARLSAAGLPRNTPTAYLQCYLAAKVHGDREAYSSALKELLNGLDAHKQHQPEVAAFCRILAGDVDEDYFKQHTSFRSQLQHLAATALEPDRLLQQQEDTEQQRQSATWEGCSGMQLQEQQLLWLLDVWGKQRMVLLGQLVPGAALTGVEAQQLQQLQQQWRRLLSQRSGEGACADAVVSTLLFWELQHHVARLQATVEAFRAADPQRTGMLDLQSFRVFCSELNDTMTNDEVLMLWDELDKQRHGSVTFRTICSCLLPAMAEA